MNQNTMNSMLLGWVMLVTTVPLQARELEISGPNEQVRLGLKTDSDGHLMYAVHSAGQTRLAWAKAGIVVDGRDLGAKVEIGEPTKRSISETFAWRGNKTLATNHCEVAKIPLRTTAGGRRWMLEVRVFDDGAAFRYRVASAGQSRVRGESTAWQVPPDCAAMAADRHG